MPLTLRAGRCSLQGNFRQNNEDSVAIAGCPDSLICVVADGMGGLSCGREASERAVVALTTHLNKLGRDHLSAAGIDDALVLAFARANESVQMLTTPGQRSGSTATLLLWPRGADRVHIGHVGDSRAYRLSGGVLEALTVDHDLRTALILNGTFTEEEARNSPLGNVLHRYLGGHEPFAGPDLKAVPIRAGDHFLLSSDGLHNHIDRATLISHLQENIEPHRRAEALCQRALENGSRDNVSCIVVDVIEQA